MKNDHNSINSELAISIHKFMRLYQHIDKPPLSPPHMFTLLYLKKHECEEGEPGEGIYPSVLSKSLHLTRPAMTQILNSLEEKGFLTRSLDENDRRKFRVKITDKGRKIFDKTSFEKNKAIKMLVTEMGKEETENAIKCLDKMSGILSENKEER